MSQWARENPEQMAEIAQLPPSQQNAALRHAIGYDPDRIRDEAEERARPATDWHACTRCRTTTLHTYEEPEQPRCIECGHALENGDDE